jgi:hypothetical protein
MDLGPTCSRQVLLQIFLVPEVSTQVLLVCMDLRPQTPRESSLAVWTKSPEVCLGRVVFPGLRPQARQPGRQKTPTLVSPIPSNAGGTTRETKSPRPFLQEVYYTSRVGGDNFSKPWVPICVRGLVKYLVCPLSPLIPPSPLQYVVAVTGNIAQLSESCL